MHEDVGILLSLPEEEQGYSVSLWAAGLGQADIMSASLRPSALFGIMFLLGVNPAGAGVMASLLRQAEGDGGGWQDAPRHI